jgi:hypothetical protein
MFEIGKSFFLIATRIFTAYGIKPRAATEGLNTLNACDSHPVSISVVTINSTAIPYLQVERRKYRRSCVVSASRKSHNMDPNTSSALEEALKNRDLKKAKELLADGSTGNGDAWDAAW